MEDVSPISQLCSASASHFILPAEELRALQDGESQVGLGEGEDGEEDGEGEVEVDGDIGPADPTEVDALSHASSVILDGSQHSSPALIDMDEAGDGDAEVEQLLVISRAVSSKLSVKLRPIVMTISCADSRLVDVLKSAESRDAPDRQAEARQHLVARQLVWFHFVASCGQHISRNIPSSCPESYPGVLYHPQSSHEQGNFSIHSMRAEFAKLRTFTYVQSYPDPACRARSLFVGRQVHVHSCQPRCPCCHHRKGLQVCKGQCTSPGGKLVFRILH